MRHRSRSGGLTARATFASRKPPRSIAAQVFSHASSLDELAVGVTAANGAWLVAAKVPDRITVVEGGKRPTTYKTYKIPRHSNAARVLTEPEFAQASRISTPPFTVPDAADLEVLEQLGRVSQ